ncbi:hypothetical protein M569_05722, partial [Genlisea aurea]
SVAYSDPQTNLLNSGCSSYNVTNTAVFFANLNSTYSALRSQLSNGTTHFATAQEAQSSFPSYGMAMCRDYMSQTDCLSCFDTAVSRIRACGAANGARVIYDGCFLRYESSGFYNQTTTPGNSQICSNKTAPDPTVFNQQGTDLLNNLLIATPRINGYFAATINTSGGNSTIYGIAQCVQTIPPTGCTQCLNQAYTNIRSCLPTTDGRAFDSGCFLRYSAAPFFAPNQTTDIAPYLRAAGSKRPAIIGGVVGGVSAILVILLAFFYFSSKTKTSRRGNILGATELQGPILFNYKDLKTATNTFSEDNKLGEGGFGDVYKANLKNGNVVAVKRLDITYGRAKDDFETEVRLISNVHHRNLVRLLGCCTKGSELLLVYEYMANGSLDRYLYGDKKGILSWKQRLDIIFGMARGLAYLHEQYHVTVIHRDIKPSNVLLDDEFQAKISDFGLARLLPENQSHVSTKFAGTLGYTAPEYAINGHLSEKVDTYSFGVVILEIISGRRCTDMNADSDTEYLLQEAWKLYEEGIPEKMADETMDSADYQNDDVKRLVEIALVCTQSPPTSRPSMSEILVLLLSDRAVE